MAKKILVIASESLEIVGTYTSKSAAKKEAPEDTVIVATPADLSVFPLSKLTTLFNAATNAGIKGLSKKDDKTLQRVFDAITGAGEEVPEAPKAKGKRAAAESEGSGEGPREGTKMFALLGRLQKGPATVEDLAKVSEYDEQNVRTAIGILRSGRVRGGTKYDVQFDRENKTYSLA